MKNKKTTSPAKTARDDNAGQRNNPCEIDQLSNGTDTNGQRRRRSPSEKSETCGRGRMRVSVERLVECCRRSNGIVSVVATLLGVDWHTADNYIKK